MTVTIRDWRTDAVLWEGEAASTKDALHKATASGAYLTRADLSGANLTRAYLSGADLTRADLTRANLSGAYLTRAYLSGADLSGAYLSGADLSGADLSGAYLSGAYLSGAYLTRANLSRANLSGAYLTRADLSGAVLSGAYLTRANLSGADLTRADLSGANLSGANQSGANGIEPARCTPLLMLLDQPGPIRAYKLVTASGEGPFNGGLVYRVGESVEVADASTDVTEACATGVHVATLDWCLREWSPGYRILLVEFTAADIAAIPTATDGKFRLFRCRAVEELDLAARGLLPATEAVA
jgi:uncharacterized protein YjbI with pentapeptide repeats